MKKFAYLALATTALLPLSARASTVVVNETLDLAQATFAPSGFTSVGGVPPFSSVQNFTLSAGDVLDYTVTFVTGQTLTLINPTLVWSYIYADVVSGANGTGTLAFLDSNGVAFLTSAPRTSTEYDVHFGQQFYDSDFAGGLPSSITFSGLRYVGTLNFYQDPSVTTRLYDVPSVVFYVDSLSVGTGAVPEPATWAMMIAGFALAGGALRRRGAIKTAVSFG